MDRRRRFGNSRVLLAQVLGMCAAALALSVPQVASAQTSAELWSSYAANPDDHPNIPNCSYAGYRYGEVPLPVIDTAIFDVTAPAYGAVANGDGDQTAAIQSAIAAAGKAGGGVVLIPEGKYRLEGLLHLNQSGVVLRGAGPDRTVLDFRRSLTQVLGANPAGSSSQWSWLGGLVWVGPEAALGGNERWRDGEVLANLSAPALRGDRSVQVDDASKLKPGSMVLLTFTLPESAGDETSFARYVYGNAETVDAYNWAGAGRLTKRRVQFPIEITTVDKQRVTFRQPLRVDVRDEWDVRIEALGPAVSEFGIEGLRIEARAPASAPGHNQNLGFNGIYINRAYHGWVKDVVIANAENGLITAAAKTVTVRNLELTGSAPQHHSMAARTTTTDCLFESFRIDGPSNVWHGINTEDFSAGNVWSKGFQARGTFDSHRALSFDFIRTEMTTANDAAGATGPANPGGAGDAGPFAGRRVVHWNIDITGKHRPAGQQGVWILHPTQFPDGAQVGIRGAPVMPTDPSDPAWSDFGVPPGGARGSIVAGVGETPAQTNLYEAQLALRLGAAPVGGGDDAGGDDGPAAEPSDPDGSAAPPSDPEKSDGSAGGAEPDGSGSDAGGGGDKVGKSGGCAVRAVQGGEPQDALLFFLVSFFAASLRRVRTWGRSRRDR